MGMWDEYCLVCGGPPYVFFDEVIDTEGEEAKKTEKDLQPIVAADFKWLEEFVGISHAEDLISLSSYNGYGAFSINTPHETNEKNHIFRIGCRSDDKNIDEFGVKQDVHGYVCHVKCFSLLQRELNYTLRCRDVRPLLEDSAICALNKFAWSDYGGFSEYQDHSFGRETQLVEDGKLWMLEDPTAISSANAQRILDLWRPLVQNGFQRPEHANGAKLPPENIIGAANADEMDVKMIPIPEPGIHFESVGAKINAEMDVKVVPELDIHCKRVGATNADDMDNIPESDCPTVEFGEYSQVTMNPS